MTENKKLEPSLFLGIDPGETTGWALAGPQMIPVTPYGQLGSMGQVGGLMALTAFLEDLSPIPDIIVFERYVVSRLDSEINTGEHETIQAIGVVKSYAFRNNIELVAQLRTVKPQGYAWHHTITRPGSKVDSHRRDAHAHLCYYQTTHKLYTPKRRK